MTRTSCGATPGRPRFPPRPERRERLLAGHDPARYDGRASQGPPVLRHAERLAFAEGNHAVNGWTFNNIANNTRRAANHMEGCNAAFLDGHVKWQKFEWFGTIQSDPTQ